MAGQMTNSQDQQNAEKIAEFLGVERPEGFSQWSLGKNILYIPSDLFSTELNFVANIKMFTKWLADDSGTVAMIKALNLKLGWTVHYFHEYESWGVLHLQGGECLFRKNDLNEGLQIYLAEINIEHPASRNT